jgi:hypothetical protein
VQLQLLRLVLKHRLNQRLQTIQRLLNLKTLLQLVVLLKMRLLRLVV